MTKPGTGGGELLIHLDVAGLAALMKAVETAMIAGRGHLALRNGGGISLGPRGCSGGFGRVTVTFAGAADPPDDNWRSGRPEPETGPRQPVLAPYG